jgi:hypothetical protein
MDYLQCEFGYDMSSGSGDDELSDTDSDLDNELDDLSWIEWIRYEIILMWNLITN